MSKGGGHGHGVSGYTHTQAQLDDIRSVNGKKV